MDVVFHIGYHKTASSWLQQIYFPAHPEIEMIADSVAPWDDPLLRSLIATSDRKFEPLQCKKLLAQNISALESSMSDNVVPVVSAERFSGYPLSGGFDSFSIARRIHSVEPQAKIIMLVRGQVEMISSVYKQMVSEGYPGRFSDMLHHTSWKTVGFDPAYFEYDILISKYHSLFGKKNVLVLPYELMRSDSKEFIRQLCDFLGVAAMQPPKTKRTINRSLTAFSLNMVRRMNYFRRSELNPYPVFNIPNGMRVLLMKLFVVVSQMLPATHQDIMSKKQKQWIVDYYKDSNMRLNKLVAIDYNNCADQ